MSIIGPRPLLVSYLNYYTETERHRHDVRPGLSLVSWSSNGQHKLFSAASFMTSLIVLCELCTLAAI